ncbi:MAG TPA: rod shape-determining protein MreD [Terriglobia bacterium]|nr:rod shape-determining protein MreD [Terriglobia bacterium]
MPSSADRPVAVYRVNLAAFWISLFVALLLQISLPIRIPLAHLFDFPLVLTIYYASIRRSKVYGIALGTGLGLIQDALSHGLIGMFGIAKCIVGYLAASVSVKFDLEQLGARYILTAVLVCVHSLVLVALRLVLFENPGPFVPLDLASTIVVNVALALICYPILDRFKRPA